MRLIDGDALEKFLSDAEVEATKRKKYVLAGALNVIQGNVRNFPTIEPEPRWIPCSEYPEYDFEDVLIRWHDKRKGCEDDYILCEGYVVRKQWCCIFEDEDMSDYEPVEWVPISQRWMNHE